MSAHRIVFVAGAATCLASVGLFYLKSYMNGPLCSSLAKIDEKVVIITGANAGIGKETARDLAQRGGRIYLACRSPSRCEAAALEIRNMTGAGERVKTLTLDLASQKSIRTFVEQFKQEESRLDILINNAGVMWPPFGKTQDGCETTFGVNHLGHFLLTHLLLGHLKSSSPSRVINLSSRAHYRGVIDFDCIQNPVEDKYSARQAYEQSKLANVLFTKSLAEKLKGTGVTVYAVHPGVVNSELWRNIPILQYPGVRQVIDVLGWLLGKNSVQGAQTSICCAVDEKLGKETGKYYSDCAEREPSALAQDKQLARRLWSLSMTMLGLPDS